MAVDGDGNIIVADRRNHRIRKISPDGNVSTLAGSGSADWGDGQGTQAHFHCPYGVAVDGEGNIIVADGNQRIRKIVAGLAPPLPRCAVRHPQLPSVFVAQMEALLDDESCSDVTFVVGDARIPAHCTILEARSEYFRAMLTSGFRRERTEEEEKSRACARGRESLGARGTANGHHNRRHDPGSLQGPPPLPLHRRAALCGRAAGRRDAQGQGDLAGARLQPRHAASRQNMSVHNVVAWLVKADEYGLEDVRTAAFGFLARNLAQGQGPGKNPQT